jgi:hypothetical protein
MVLARNQTQRAVEQNRRPRNKFTQLQPSDFDKEAKNIHWRQDSLFNELCWENWLSTCSMVKLGPYLSLCIKINSKLFEDFNVRSKTTMGKHWKIQTFVIIS